VLNKFPFGASGGRTTESFAEKATFATRLIEYLEMKGIRARQTRLGEYESLLQRLLSSNYNDKEMEDKLLLVMRELDEWSWIYRGLMKAEPEGSLELLRQAVDGVAFAKDESTNTRPRNTQLELRVASYFLQAGFPVSFSGLSDLVVDVEGFPVFVECKRLNSPKQVDKRAKEAARQLRHRYKSTLVASYGLVVLDISRIIHPKQGIGSAPSLAMCRAGLQDQLKEFDREYDTSPIFFKDKKLILVWKQAIAPAFYYDLDVSVGSEWSLHIVFIVIFCLFARASTKMECLPKDKARS